MWVGRQSGGRGVRGNGEEVHICMSSSPGSGGTPGAHRAGEYVILRASA